MQLENYETSSKRKSDDLLLNTTNTFFANVFSRHNAAFVQVPEDMELDSKLPYMMYRYLCKVLSKLGSVCLKYCESVVSPVVAIVKQTTTGIVMVRNPQLYAYKTLVSTLCPETRSFKNIDTDPILYWQQRVEPISVTELSYT